MGKNKGKGVLHTKAEQDALLANVACYANRNPDPEISANHMDFSKPVDDSSNQ